jgi:hypothetical protein
MAHFLLKWYYEDRLSNQLPANVARDQMLPERNFKCEFISGEWVTQIRLEIVCFVQLSLSQICVNLSIRRVDDIQRMAVHTPSVSARFTHIGVLDNA